MCFIHMEAGYPHMYGIEDASVRSYKFNCASLNCFLSPSQFIPLSYRYCISVAKEQPKWVIRSM